MASSIDHALDELAQSEVAAPDMGGDLAACVDHRRNAGIGDTDHWQALLDRA